MQLTFAKCVCQLGVIPGGCLPCGEVTEGDEEGVDHKDERPDMAEKKNRFCFISRRDNRDAEAAEYYSLHHCVICVKNSDLKI